MTTEEAKLFKSFRTKIGEIVEEERFRLGGLPRPRLEQLVSQLIREKLASDHGIFTVDNILHACFSRAVALHCFGFAENCIHELVLQLETMLRCFVCESMHMDKAAREYISLGILVARSPKSHNLSAEQIAQARETLAKYLTAAERDELARLNHIRNSLIHNNNEAIRRIANRMGLQDNPSANKLARSLDRVQWIIFCAKVTAEVGTQWFAERIDSQAKSDAEQIA